MKIPAGVVVHIGVERFVGEVPDAKAAAVGVDFPDRPPGKGDPGKPAPGKPAPGKPAPGKGEK